MEHIGAFNSLIYRGNNVLELVRTVQWREPIAQIDIHLPLQTNHPPPQGWLWSWMDVVGFCFVFSPSASQWINIILERKKVEAMSEKGKKKKSSNVREEVNLECLALKGLDLTSCIINHSYAPSLPEISRVIYLFFICFVFLSATLRSSLKPWRIGLFNANCLAFVLWHIHFQNAGFFQCNFSLGKTLLLNVTATVYIQLSAKPSLLDPPFFKWIFVIKLIV